MIVVTAAGGATGRAVVQALGVRGLPVRAVVGSPGPLAPVLADAEALYLIWPNVDAREADGAAALFREAHTAAEHRADLELGG